MAPQASPVTSMSLNNRETQPPISHFQRHLEQGQLCPRHSLRLQELRAAATSPCQLLALWSELHPSGAV